jgi:hypothetical protein
MAYKIGFTAEESENTLEQPAYEPQAETVSPRQSVVQIRFPQRDNMSLAYYNDRFDLHKGDLVYVDGKLEGMLGRVTDVNYNFKIKMSEYKRVIAVVDTSVHGEFYMAGSHFVTFDPAALPVSKASLWFKAPGTDEDIVSGQDETSFSLDELGTMNVSAEVAERGHSYYVDNKVRYICIDGTTGYALVEGSKSYEVEFQYRSRDISGLVCSCYSSTGCKHEVAAMLQLRETLGNIEKNYEPLFEKSGYFAAIDKGTFFTFAVDAKTTGSFVI